jgi:hypothetical protein
LNPPCSERRLWFSRSAASIRVMIPEGSMKVMYQWVSESNKK